MKCVSNYDCTNCHECKVKNTEKNDYKEKLNPLCFVSCFMVAFTRPKVPEKLYSRCLMCHISCTFFAFLCFQNRHKVVKNWNAFHNSAVPRRYVFLVFVSNHAIRNSIALSATKKTSPLNIGNNKRNQQQLFDNIHTSTLYFCSYQRSTIKGTK